MKKHFVFIDREKWDREYLQKSFARYKLTFLTKIGQYDKIKDAEILSIFINTQITKSVLDKLPKLKFIATRSTGFDHIDVKECKKRGIKVANVPTYVRPRCSRHK